MKQNVVKAFGLFVGLLAFSQSAPIFAGDFADPNFPRPGGTVKVNDNQSLWWKYVNDKLLVRVDEANPDHGNEPTAYYGFDKDGSFLLDPDAGEIWRFDGATKTLINYAQQFGRKDPYDTSSPPTWSIYPQGGGTYESKTGYMSPPDDIDTRGHSDGTYTEWCDLAMVCRHARISRDESGLFVLSYAGNLTESNGLRTVHVCRLRASPQMAALMAKMAAQTQQAYKSLGASSTATPAPMDGEWIGAKPDSQGGNNDYSLKGDSVEWKAIPDLGLQAIKQGGGSCQTR